MDIRELWTPTPKNQVLRQSRATNRLRVGGTGSSKSSDALMEAFEYMVRYPGLQVLFLRRQITDLRKSSMLDWHTFIPQEFYASSKSDNIETLYNGSKLFWGHLPNSSEKDLQQYLSAAFPVIVLDECGQFSGEAYQFLSSRNRVNRECQPDENGEYPTPVMLGCTNPVGPHWGFYKAQFVDRKPFDPPEGARRDRNGRYWVEKAGEFSLVYDPDDWEYIHSTLLDNPHLMQRDPDLHRKLMALPAALRDKLLHGYLDSTVGQYFDCWSEDRAVVSLSEDAEAILWQPWQPRWISWDWGRAHWTSIYWWTLALARGMDGQYREKVVCYREYVDRGKDYSELAHTIASLTRLGLPDPARSIAPGMDAWSVRAIYFSHEKFARGDRASSLPAHSPAAEVTRYLSREGLPGVTRNNAAAGSRVEKATLLYSYLAKDKLVVLDTCRGIIEAIPQLVRDEANIEDVLKIDGKADDCYDGFTMGLYNWFGKGAPPQEIRDRERLERIEDPLQQRLEQFRLTMERQKRAQEPERRPEWM